MWLLKNCPVELSREWYVGVVWVVPHVNPSRKLLYKFYVARYVTLHVRTVCALIYCIWLVAIYT